VFTHYCYYKLHGQSKSKKVGCPPASVAFTVINTNITTFKKIKYTKGTAVTKIPSMFVEFSSVPL
jgi:hypothetical protein